MSDLVPHEYDVTVPQGFNASRIKKGHADIRIHYITPDKWKIGITEAETPNGNIVKLYNKERCIIDLIKRKDKIEKQLYLHALREYFADGTTDKTALIKYAKIFNHIEEKVRDYTDILS